ncbi:restriction endonuclease subunit S [Acinetobacter indicus]|uniref:restriction endonuclease subunit S n=1 Tax=Acinetobacter indicus TaxID=756892 RepID=UPI0012E20EBD|nr:restriction endonuclease subunit S [Acinetobacter indicus]
MAKYQAYAEYKDSGVEWLGEIPSHWDLQRLKVILNERNEKNDPIKSTNILSLTMHQGVIPYSEKEGSGGNKPKEDLTAYKLVYENDIVLNSMNVIVGSVGISRYFGIASLVYYMLYPRNLNQTNIRFYNYIFQAKSFQENLGRLGTGILIKKSESSGKLNTIRMKISMEDLNNEILTIPSVEEQTQIANFLDHETAKIDHLIEKQQQLIELLKEKRQAVISHAVTKGLDPNVPMKDSGVEWLGEVPEHWEVSKFGFISQVVRGGSPRPAGDPTLFNGDYSPWVTVAEITKDDELYLTSTETFLTKKGSEQCRVFKAGTLLLSNSGATLGVPKILCIDANANDGVVGFEQLQIDIEFAYYYLSILTNDLRERVKQGSGQPNLNTDIVKNISIAIPPISEIQSIVAEIKGQVEKFVCLIQKAEQQILLMQERRTALISAAVTGKIDVRHWQAPTLAEAHTELSA